jgi:hypothetical protein
MNNDYEIDFELQSIIDNALRSNGENRISKELTVIQAENIRYRSNKLKKNKKSFSISPEEKARQIELCWKQRQRNLKAG